MYVLLGCLYIYYPIYLAHLQSPSLCEEPRYLIVHSLVYIIVTNCYNYYNIQLRSQKLSSR